MSVVETPRLDPYPDKVPASDGAHLAAVRSGTTPMNSTVPVTTVPVNTVPVAIGIPVYNGEKYIAETLDSVLAQTHQSLEIVIADNASTDGTHAILAHYEELDPRIRVIYNEVNVGAAGNYNLVLHEASSDFFAWLSADDVLEPTFIERNLQLLVDNPDAIGSYAEAKRIDQFGADRGDYRAAMAGMQLSSARPGVRFSSAVLGFPAIVLFGVYRRQAMLETPGHGAFIGGDRVFVSEMALKGRILRIDELLFRRRVHAEAYSALLNKQARAKWFAGDEAKAGFADLNRIKQHHAALTRSAPDAGTRVRGLVTLFAGFPIVLGKARAVGVLERVMGLFGRTMDHSNYAS